MTQQPEALRLADEFERPYWDDGTPHGQLVKAATELRRLHAQRDALLEVLKLAWPIIEAEKYKQDCSYGKNFVQTKADRARSVYDKARAAIAKATGEQP